MLFDSFEFDRRLLRAIDHIGWDMPTPVQEEAMPVALSGRDLLACARTGSGKTGGFVLPTLQRLLHEEPRKGRGPRVLCLCPTRELAAQVSDQVDELSRYTRLTGGLIVGGEPYPPQLDLLQRGVDFLTGTPGRLIDHLKSGKLKFDEVEVLVLDEADRMLDMGFIDDVMRLANACPQQRQTLFFSATLDGPVDSVARRLVSDPVKIEVDTADSRHLDIEELLFRADNEGHKQSILLHLLSDPDLSQGLIFVARKGAADELASMIRMAGHDVVALHGDMPQVKRSRVVERLRQGNVRIMVATDVAARGLDITGVTHVINYDLPRTPREYVHRIGRTGRAGAKGTAVSLVTPPDWIKMSDVELFHGEPLERMVIPGLEPTRPAPPGAARVGKLGRGRRRYGRRGGMRSRSPQTEAPDPDDS
jgi:superfamily II DNA/RNA helicase